MTYKRRKESSWRSGAAATAVVAALALAGSANGQCVPGILGSVDTPGFAWGVAVSGAVAYVGDGSSGLQVIDVSDPGSPVILGSVDTRDSARGVAVRGCPPRVRPIVAGRDGDHGSRPPAVRLRSTAGRFPSSPENQE